jgi:hypothetical protein
MKNKKIKLFTPGEFEILFIALDKLACDLNESDVFGDEVLTGRNKDKKQKEIEKLEDKLDTL